MKTIADAAGIVRYEATLRQHVVAVHQPGTYDSVEVGVVCGTLPVALQQAGARVTVSGTFKEYGQPAPSPVVAGTTIIISKRQASSRVSCATTSRRYAGAGNVRAATRRRSSSAGSASSESKAA